jgi:hypothetical protein
MLYATTLIGRMRRGNKGNPIDEKLPGQALLVAGMKSGD